MPRGNATRGPRTTAISPVSQPQEWQLLECSYVDDRCGSPSGRHVPSRHLISRYCPVSRRLPCFRVVAADGSGTVQRPLRDSVAARHARPQLPYEVHAELTKGDRRPERTNTDLHANKASLSKTASLVTPHFRGLDSKTSRFREFRRVPGNGLGTAELDAGDSAVPNRRGGRLRHQMPCQARGHRHAGFVAVITLRRMCCRHRCRRPI
jgi:hypothetical protein